MDHCSSDGPAGARQGPESRDHPLVESGRHTREEPSGERKHEENESEEGGGTRRGVLRAAWRGECNCMECAVGQLSALLSSLGFMSDTIYLAVKPLQPSHSPLSLFLPLTFYN